MSGWWQAAITVGCVAVMVVPARLILMALLPRPIADFPRPDIAGVSAKGDSGPDDWDLQRVSLEVDRVRSIAKGLASTAAAFLVALFTALLDTKAHHLSTWLVLGCLAGVVGALGLAGLISVKSRQFVDDPGGQGS